MERAVKRLKNSFKFILISLFSLGFCFQTHATLERNVIEILDDGYAENIFDTPHQSSFGPYLSSTLQTKQPNYCVHASGVVVHRSISNYEKTDFQKKENLKNEVKNLQELIDTTKQFFNNVNTCYQAYMQKQNIFQATLETAKESKKELQEKLQNFPQHLQKKNDAIIDDIKIFLNIGINSQLIFELKNHANGFLTYARNEIKKQEYDVQLLEMHNIKDAIKNWKIYNCSKTDSYLFIPKNAYMNTIKTGFALDSLFTEITSFDELTASVKPWENKLFVKQRKNIPLKWKDFEDIYVPGSQGWVFSHVGHGLFKPKEHNTLSSHKNAYIAGLVQQEALKRLTFIGTKIKSIATIGTSCFGGGQQARTVLKHLQKLEKENPHFKPYIYGVKTLTDTESSEDALVDFNGYFDNVRKLHVKNTGEKNTFYLEQALRSVIINEFSDPRLIPIVRVPRAERFHALALTSLLSESTVVNATTAKQNVKVNTEKDVAVLLDDVKLGTISVESSDENKGTPFVSMLLGDAAHRIKAITSKTCNFETILRSFFEIKETSKKIFIIQEMTTKNQSDKENFVIFKTFEHDESNNVKTKGYIFYKEKNIERYYRIFVKDSFEGDIHNYIYHSTNKQSQTIKRKLSIDKPVQIKKEEYVEAQAIAHKQYLKQLPAGA